MMCAKARTKKRSRIPLVLTAAMLLCGLSAAFTGCGKQAYVVSANTEHQSSAGNFVIPPKVDIILGINNTGRMYEAYQQFASQMPDFLTNLQGQNWDYHFVSVPLASDQTITQVVASQFDSNWGSSWIPPYPGAQAGGPGTLPANFFQTPTNYSGFLNSGQISNNTGGMEPGFEELRRALSNGVKGTGFLRPDALLAIVVASTGDDTSDVKYCPRNDDPSGSLRVPCDDPNALQTNPTCGTPDKSVASCGTLASSMTEYTNAFKSLKTSPALLRFYAAVSNEAGTCLGGHVSVGARYQQMASNLNTLNGSAWSAATQQAQFDLCNQSIASILSTLTNDLQSVKVAFETRYLFISGQPNVSTIQVVRYPGGDTSNPQTIPQDSNNGWTYAGYLTNAYAIDAPVPMNPASGYAIELHGDAKLHGSDTADVTFKPYGATDSAGNWQKRPTR